MRDHQDAVEPLDGDDAHTASLFIGREDRAQVCGHVHGVVVPDGDQVDGVDGEILGVQQPDQVQGLLDVPAVIGDQENVDRNQVDHSGSLGDEGLHDLDHVFGGEVVEGDDIGDDALFVLQPEGLLRLPRRQDRGTGSGLGSRRRLLCGSLSLLGRPGRGRRHRLSGESRPWRGSSAPRRHRRHGSFRGIGFGRFLPGRCGLGFLLPGVLFLLDWSGDGPTRAGGRRPGQNLVRHTGTLADGQDHVDPLLLDDGLTGQLEHLLQDPEEGLLGDLLHGEQADRSGDGGIDDVGVPQLGHDGVHHPIDGHVGEGQLDSSASLAGAHRAAVRSPRRALDLITGGPCRRGCPGAGLGSLSLFPVKLLKSLPTLLELVP